MQTFGISNCRLRMLSLPYVPKSLYLRLEAWLSSIENDGPKICAQRGVSSVYIRFNWIYTYLPRPAEHDIHWKKLWFATTECAQVCVMIIVNEEAILITAPNYSYRTKNFFLWCHLHPFSWRWTVSRRQWWRAVSKAKPGKLLMTEQGHREKKPTESLGEIPCGNIPRPFLCTFAWKTSVTAKLS